MSRVPVVLALALAAPAVAAVPVSVVQQGRLLDESGAPRSGPATLTFTLHGAPSGGDVAWSSGPMTVELGVSGHFAVVLGTDANPLDADVLDAAGAWLAMSVDDEPELSPRLPITALPYAAVADRADAVASGAVDADALAPGAVGDDHVSGLSWSRIDGVPAPCPDGHVLAGDAGGWRCAVVSQGIEVTAPLSSDGDALSVARADADTDGTVAAEDFARFDARVAEVRAGAGVEVTGDPGTPTVSVVPGDTPGTAASGDDPRLSDPRPPTPGSDAYLHADPASPQDASVAITGDATFGGTLSAGAFARVGLDSIEGAPPRCDDGRALLGADGGWTCADVVGTVSADGPLAATDATLSMPRADALTDGYVAADDFARFGARLDALSAADGLAVTGDPGAPTVGVVFGAASGTATEGDDPRLSDPRPPTAGSPDYLQNRPDSPQDASFALTGDATVGGTLSAGRFVGVGWDDLAGAPAPCADGVLAGVDGDFTCIGAVTAVTADAPLSVSGDTAPVVSLDRADAVTDGYVAADDFARFDDKVDVVSAGDGVTVGGTPTAPSIGVTFGTDAGTAAEGDDPRFSDARAPTPGSGHYVQNRAGSPQAAALSISGAALVGGTLSASAYEGVAWGDLDGRLPSCPDGQVLTGADGAFSCTDNVQALAATAPLTASGATTRALSAPDASRTADGVLAATDFARFDDKVTALHAGDGVAIAGSATDPRIDLTYGDAPGTAVAGDDPRLTDRRVPRPGSPDYLQPRPADDPQDGALDITGDAAFGGGLTTPTLDVGGVLAATDFRPISGGFNLGTAPSNYPVGLSFQTGRGDGAPSGSICRYGIVQTMRPDGCGTTQVCWEPAVTRVRTESCPGGTWSAWTVVGP